MSRLWSALVDRHLVLSERRAGSVLLFWLMLAIGSALLARRVVVEARLEALLPADSPAVLAVEEARSRVPSTSPLYLLVSSSEPELNRNLARQIAEKARQWPETLSVIVRRDPSYFLDRALLFMNAERLDELALDVETVVDLRRCRAMPGCFALEDEPELPTEAELIAEISAQPNVRSLLSLLGMEKVPTPDSASAAQPTSAHSEGKETGGEPLPGDLCSPNGEVCTVQIVLDGKPTDLAFSERIVDRANAVMAALRPADAPPDLQLETSGSYRNVVMTKQSVGRDLTKTALVSFGCMLLILLLQFRGLRAFVLLLAPLVAGSLVTLGGIGWVHPELNLISSFTLAVLVGLGLDFGVHLLTHYGQRRNANEPPALALRSAFHSLQGPMLVATITTACGFGALLAARFRGFAEMGAMACAGILIAFLAYFSLFPALVLFLHRVRPETSSCVREWKRSLLTRLHIKPRTILWGGLLAGLGAVFFAKDLDFEYNFRNLSPRQVAHGIRWGASLHGTTRPAVLMLADSPEQLEATAAALRKEDPSRLRLKDDRPWLVTPASFVPANQERKQQALARLRKAYEEATRHAGKSHPQLKSLQRWIQPRDSISVEGLPGWVADWLTERDGRFGNYGLIYTGLGQNDALQMQELSQILRDWSSRFPGVTFASSGALIGVVIPGLQRDAPVMIGLALLGLCVGTLGVGRSLRRLGWVLAPVLLAVVLSSGVAALLGLKINLYNLVVFPLAFGVGVDGAVYVVWAIHKKAGVAGAHLPVVLRGVLGSTLTTTAGFGGLMLASNPGLASLGQLAAITFLSTLVANLVWLPAAMQAAAVSSTPGDETRRKGG